MRGAGAKIDFAALRILKVVGEYGSISVAARRLALEQSTVSHTLGRLRKFFGDPLLVPGLGGMAATERCRAIVGELGYVLDRYDSLCAPRRFEPGTAKFEVVIAGQYASRTILFTPILAYLRRQVPGIRLRFIRSPTTPFDALENGLCDIAVAPSPSEPVSCHRRFLIKFPHVCLVASNGPYASGITSEQNFSARHVRSIREECGAGRELRERGCTVLDLPNLADIDLFIEDTDFVATVPMPLAPYMSRRVSFIAPPFPIMSDLHMFWTGRTHEAPHMRWMRMVIADAAAVIAGEGRAIEMLAGRQA